jgi:hypothetical protein
MPMWGQLAMGLAINLIATAIAYKVGGKDPALVLFCLGIAIIGAVVIFARKAKLSSEGAGNSGPLKSNSATTNTDSFNPKQEQRVGDIRTGDVNVDFHLPESFGAAPRTATAAPIEESPKPSVQCLGVDYIPVSFGSPNSTTIYRADATRLGEADALIVKFRNEGKQVAPAYRVKARVRFLDSDDKEIDPGVSAAAWLGTGSDAIMLKIDESEYVVLLLKFKSGKLVAPGLRRLRTRWGNPTVEAWWDLQSPPAMAEVRLRDDDGNGDSLATALVMIVEGDGVLKGTIGQQ